jgi:hypothetical protein
VKFKVELHIEGKKVKEWKGDGVFAIEWLDFIAMIKQELSKIRFSQLVEYLPKDR